MQCTHVFSLAICSMIVQYESTDVNTVGTLERNWFKNTVRYSTCSF